MSAVKPTPVKKKAQLKERKTRDFEDEYSDDRAEERSRGAMFCI
jgi:hypothetical protein